MDGTNNLIDAVKTQDPVQILLLLGLVVATFLLLRRAYAQRTRPARASSARSTSQRSGSGMLGARLASDLEVQLHDSFREMNSRLDTKTHVLNELLLEAESKISELRGLLGESPALVVRRPSPSPQVHKYPPIVGAEDDRDVDIELARDVEPDSDLGHSADPGELDDEPLVIDLESKLARKSPIFGQIYRMADDGRSPGDIADETGKPVGEIELILGLRRRREQA